jgi:adenylate cyclase
LIRFEPFRLSVSRRVHDRRLQSRLQIGSSLALGIGLLVSASIFFGLFDSPQPSQADLLYQPRSPSGQVVIVAIDDASLQRIGPWPWTRTTIANLIENINAVQPRVVALDLLLSNSADDDPTLAQALSASPRTVLAVAGVSTGPPPTRPNAFPQFEARLLPSVLLPSPTSALGHVMISPDSDGVTRRIAAAIDASDQRYPALGIAAVELSQNRLLARDIENDRVAFGDAFLPVDRQGQIRLSFYAWGAGQVISAADVLQHRADLSRLNDRIVLLGAVGSSAADSFRTPVSPKDRPSFSVEIQADVIETILGNHFLVEQDRLTQVMVILLLALLAGATLPNVRLGPSIGLTLLYLAMYLSYAFQKFDDGILVQPIYPVLALLLTALAVMLFRYFSEERQRAMLQQLFLRYVPPEVVERVLSTVEDGSFRLHGERKEVSLLYVDMRELGVLAESLSAEASINVLNQYVSLVVGAIFRHGGLLTKHTGDTIIAVWNLPFDQLDHACRAVRAAIDVKHEVDAIRMSQPKGMAIQVGIGVGTGSVVAGRIGASARTEYTILGEVLVMAERMAMKMDRGVFVDYLTRDQIGDQFETREVNPVRLRRKTDPVLVWEISEPLVLEEETPAPPQNQEPIAN